MYSLNDELKRVTDSILLDDGWQIYSIAIPKSFMPIFQKCLNRYKALLNSDKDFPAFEGMILEAMNSLPDEMGGEHGQSRQEEVDSHS